ncbi:asparaginase [Streptomyces sp. F001]|uniref:asparaginase n=1 Tax=Streptomyces sp. F001 TaxID=1510026 RepID=UPI001F118478|nr:asparaginase [Streptomyces sp. F001]
MLYTAKLNGWSLDDYSTPPIPSSRPSPRSSRTTGQGRQGAVDGCGAPLFSVSLHGLARAAPYHHRRSRHPEARVADAMREHAEMASRSGGTWRADAGRARTARKDGFEGVQVAALRTAGPSP